MSGSDNNPVVRFGILTDIHYSTENEPAADLRTCLQGFRNSNTDFMLQLGDLIRGNSSASAGKELQDALAVLRNFQGTIRHVIGNHCLALPRPELMNSLGLRTPYYAFSEKVFRFVVLDGMDISVHRQPETPEDSLTLARFRSQMKINPELHDYCGAVGILQRAWLKKELEKAEKTGEKVIIVCHFPLHPATTDIKHGLLWNHREIVELLAASPAVKVCLGGHYHNGGYARQSGIHFVVLPAFVNRQEHPAVSCATATLECRRLLIRSGNDDVLYDLSLN